jgi:uncharacterized membrane protein YdbT with pleckstrin-like domain
MGTLVWGGQPSRWYYVASYVLAAVLVLMGAVAFPLLLLLGDAGAAPALIVGAMFAAGGLLLAIGAALSRSHTYYRLTTTVATVEWGVFSRHSREVPLNGIREVLLNSGLIERSLNLGDIGLSTAASSDVEVWFKGIESPEAVRGLVRQYMREA